MCDVFRADLIHRIRSGTPLTLDGRQLSSAVQLRQHMGIASVDLYPVARLHRNGRGRDDHAAVAEFSKLPMQAIAAGPSLWQN